MVIVLGKNVCRQLSGRFIKYTTYGSWVVVCRRISWNISTCNYIGYIRATLTFFFVFVAFHLQSQSEWGLCSFYANRSFIRGQSYYSLYIHLLCIALYHIMASVHILTLPDHRSRHNNNNNIVSLQQYNCMFTKYGHLDSDRIQSQTQETDRQLS